MIPMGRNTAGGHDGLTRRSVLAASAGVVTAGAVGTGSAATGIAGGATTTPPEPAWTATLDRPDQLRRMRAAGGLLLAAYPDELVAHSREDGSRQWSYEPEARQYAVTPHEGTAYVRRFGTVTAVGPEGNREWRHEHGEETVSTAVAGETVFVGDDASLVGLSADGGNEEWRVESGPTRPIAAGAGGVIAREGLDGEPDRLAAIESGETGWSYDAPEPVTSIDHDAGRLFVALSDRTVALDTADGSVAWEAGTGRGDPRSALRTGDLDALGAGGRVVGVEHGSGDVRWANPIASDVLVVGGTESVTVALSQEPTVYVLERERGEVVLEADLGGDGLAFPRPADAAGGHTYVAASGVLTALGPDGAERWSRSLGGAANSVGVDDGALFVLDGDTLYRFPAAADAPDDSAPDDSAFGGNAVLLAAAGVLGGGAALAYYFRDRLSA